MFFAALAALALALGPLGGPAASSVPPGVAPTDLPHARAAAPVAISPHDPRPGASEHAFGGGTRPRRVGGGNPISWGAFLSGAGSAIGQGIASGLLAAGAASVIAEALVAAPFVVAALLPSAAAVEEDAGECTAAGGAGEGVTLYRAVGGGELADIQAVGRYRVPAGGVEGKYFFQTPEQASNFARMMGDQPYTTTSVSMSPAELGRAQSINPAGEGPGYFFSTPDLPTGPVTIWDYSVVPP